MLVVVFTKAVNGLPSPHFEAIDGKQEKHLKTEKLRT